MRVGTDGTVQARQTADFAVIGGGIAGVSAAAELASHGSVVLIEAESQPGYHATGRSAAILAQTYGSAVIRALTRASAPFFAAPPEGFSDTPLLAPRGLVLVARPDQVEGLRAMFDEVRGTARVDWVEGPALEAMVPLLRPGHAAGGFVNADAQDIDVHALLGGYLRLFRQRGGTVLTGAPVAAMRQDGGWTLTAGESRIEAGIVVNAAGAWADRIAALAGAAPAGLTPRRRSAITFRPPGGVDVGAMPMVVDADEQFYLKPEAGRLMASPADETPSAPCDSRPEEIDIAICVDRITAAFDLEVRRIESSWSGLRTFAVDRAPLCGFDPEVKGLFWLAAQGGYGVQTAPALARLTAALATGSAPDAEIAAAGLDLGDISPGRLSLAA